MFSKLKPINEVSIVRRKNDILTVVEINDISHVTPNEISLLVATKQPTVPQYKPDGTGATLVFHTESDVFVLGGIRNNSALEKHLTKDNTPFPQQISSTIGGYLKDPTTLSLKEAILDAIKIKLFLKVEFAKDSPEFEAQQIIAELANTIASNEGWEEKICIHTDHWPDKDGTTKTMCYLTAIKHIHCSDSDLAIMSQALQTMSAKQAQGVNPQTLSAFKFVPLIPIITNAVANYLEDDVTKAKNAYEKYGNGVVVTFNELAMATLGKNGAFQSRLAATLIFSKHSPKYTLK